MHSIFFRLRNVNTQCMATPHTFNQQQRRQSKIQHWLYSTFEYVSVACIHTHSHTSDVCAGTTNGAGRKIVHSESANCIRHGPLLRLYWWHRFSRWIIASVSATIEIWYFAGRNNGHYAGVENGFWIGSATICAPAHYFVDGSGCWGYWPRDHLKWYIYEKGVQNPWLCVCVYGGGAISFSF